MDSGISITINLPGRLGPMLKHTTKQVFSADITPLGSKNREILTRKILHTDRIPSVSSKILKISPLIVNYWTNGECPIWANPKFWKKLSKTQKIAAYVSTFDEGYGVSYE